MEEQKKELIAKLDTEGDILLGITRNDDGTVTATVRTPNNVPNSQLLENMRKLCPGATELNSDGKSFSFTVATGENEYEISIGRRVVLVLDKEMNPLGLDEIIEGTNEVKLDEEIYPATKARLAQKTEYEPSTDDYDVFSKTAAERATEDIGVVGRTDLHNHLAGILPPDRLIALGIRHNVDYNIILIQKYGIELPEGKEGLELKKRLLEHANIARKNAGEETIDVEDLSDEDIETCYNALLEDVKNGKLSKDDLEKVVVPFNDIITVPGNLEKISLSMRLPIEGQTVFTKLEEVYDARDPFTKRNGRVVSRGEAGTDTPENPIVPTEDEINDVLTEISQMDSYAASEVARDLQEMAEMQSDIEHDESCKEGLAERFRNGLQEDMSLWIAEEERRGGVEYVETAQASLAKKNKNIEFLNAINEVEEYIQQRTGTKIRYLAAIRRNFSTQEDFDEATRNVIESARSRLCVGVDFMGEELNETEEVEESIIEENLPVSTEKQSFISRIVSFVKNIFRKNK